MAFFNFGADPSFAADAYYADAIMADGPPHEIKPLAEYKLLELRNHMVYLRIALINSHKKGDLESFDILLLRYDEVFIVLYKKDARYRANFDNGKAEVLRATRERNKQYYLDLIEAS